MTNKVRIIDIAKKAGVSKGTVDRVIHKRGHVAPKVEARIQAVMKELNYQPNIIASTLASNKQWKVATLLPNPAEDPFWAQPQQGIEYAIPALRDYGMIVDTYHFRDANTRDFSSVGEQILQKKYDAILVAPLYFKEAHQFLDQCKERKLPYGLINTYIDRKDEQCLFYLGQDSYHSGVLAAKLLDFGINDKEAVMVLHLEKAVFNARHLLEKEQGFQNFFVNHPNRKVQVIKTSYEEPTDTIAFRRFMELQLTSYPRLKGVFVTSSKLYYLVKALEGLPAAHLKLIGFDLIDENIQYLNQDKIDFLINQNPMRQGYQGVLNLFNFLVRKSMPAPLQNLPLDVVMKENVVYYKTLDHLPLII